MAQGRHCPKCQALAKERWIENQKSNLINVGYFHMVFTIPDSLNSMTYQNQKAVYTLLFKAVSETLSELASDKRYLGAKIRFYIDSAYLGASPYASSASSLYCPWGRIILYRKVGE